MIKLTKYTYFADNNNSYCSPYYSAKYPEWYALNDICNIFNYKSRLWNNKYQQGIVIYYICG